MKIPRGDVGGEAFDCYDVLADLDEAMRDGMAPEHSYYMLGGVTSEALKNEQTVLDKPSQLVVPSKDLRLPTVRDNGTRRDVDILVNSILSDEDAARIKTSVEEAVKGHLVVSVFGFDRHVPQPGRKERVTKRLGDWVSSRTIDEEGALRYELFPLAREVRPASYEPWKLELRNSNTVEVLHPVGHTLAYDMRSISGPRKKDADKRAAMWRNVLPVFPDALEPGAPFYEWQQFAHDINMVFYKRVPVAGTRPGYHSFDISMFRGKSGILRALESNEAIVNFGQNETVQSLLNIFVRAK